MKNEKKRLGEMLIEAGLIDELGFTLGLKIKPVLALESEIKTAIAEHYEDITHTESKTHRASIEKIAEEMDLLRTEHVTPQAEKETPEKQKDFSLKSVVEVLISALAEKGIITKEELIRKSNEKHKKS